MTTDGGGWTLAVNSFFHDEPPTTDMTSNTGVVELDSAGHTRDLTNLAINNNAEIRYYIAQVAPQNRFFHAKFTGRYHNALPPFAAWTTLPGHTPGAESMMSSHFGMNWSTPLSDRDIFSSACSSLSGNLPWHYSNCWNSIPTNPVDGSTQGPVTSGAGAVLFQFSDLRARSIHDRRAPGARRANFRAAVNLPVGT